VLLLFSAPLKESPVLAARQFSKLIFPVSARFALSVLTVTSAPRTKRTSTKRGPDKVSPKSTANPLLVILAFSVLSALLILQPTNSTCAVGANTFAQDNYTVTSQNWQQHPKIKAVRSVVESINAGLRKKSFKISVRKFEYCESYEDTFRKMAVDSKGVVRRYENEAGSDDSALTWEHYYDEAGRLRFVFITGGAANGSQLEHRIYFDETGKRIWEEHKYVKGPGYTFPEVWPEEKNDQARPIQKFDAAKAFAATSPCPEVKKRGARE